MKAPSANFERAGTAAMWADLDAARADRVALRDALTALLDANDAVQNVLCDGPDVPGFDPTALDRAQLRVTDAEVAARAVLARIGAA